MPTPSPQRRGQHDRTVSNALEARYAHALRFEQPSHLAVAALHQRHVIPMVVAGAAVSLDVGEFRDAVVEQHAFPQRTLHVFVDDAGDPHRVFPVDTGRRMHQPVRQCAVVGQQQQSARIDVETSNDHPTAARELRQPVETGRPSVRIAARAHHTVGFVHDQNAYGRLGAMVQWRAVDGDLIVNVDPVAQRRALAVDRDATRFDPPFHFATRAETRIRHHLVEFLGRRNFCRGRCCVARRFAR